MALSAVMSMFPGAFECAKRDTSDGFCGGRQKRPPTMVSDEQNREAAQWISAGPMGSTSMNQQMAGAGHLPDFAQTLYRMPSPGLSSQDLSCQSLHLDSSTFLQSREEIGNHPSIWRSAFSQKLEQVESVDSVYPGDLPRNFFSKIADLIAMDKEIQNKLKGGETHFFAWNSCRSRFLQACVKGDERLASHLWKSISEVDRQELLMAYSRGTPSSDLFVNMMSSLPTP